MMPSIPAFTRRMLLTTAGGALLALLPVGFGQGDGAFPFAPPAALANDRDDDRDDREDRRDDRRDDGEDLRDDRNDDDDDDDRSGRDGGDDRDDRDDPSGSDDDTFGGSDDRPDSDDDNSGNDDGRSGSDDDRSGGDDSDDDPRDDDDRDDDDRDDDRSDTDDSRDTPRATGTDTRQPSSGRIRNITVTYPDGWIERIVNGQYELIDDLNRRVILRPATQEDFARMMALG